MKTSRLTLPVLSIGLGVALFAAVAAIGHDIDVVAPRGGEKIPIGSTFTIKWNLMATDGVPAPGSSYDIMLSTDGGKSFPIPIVMNLPAPADHFTWKVSGPATQTARIQITLKSPDNGGNNPMGTSGDNFAITGPGPSGKPTPGIEQK